MNRYPRYVLIIFAVSLTILLPGLAIYIAATFDPNAYKPQIIQLVKEKNQRDLKLDGDIKLTFFPRLGAEINGLSLSEYQNGGEFASAENILVSLAFLPLLRKQLELDEIVVTGLKANLIRFTDGHTNIDDLLVKSDEEQFKFDIGRVLAEKSTLIFRDEVSQKQYIFGDLNLKADKIDVRSSSADDAIHSKLELAFRMNQPEQPEIDQAIRLSLDLMLDAANQYYAVSGLNLESKGTINGINNLVINSTGDFSARFAAAGAVGDEFMVTGLTLGMTGISEGNNLDMQLNAPRLSLNGEKLASDGIVAVLKIIGSGGNTNGNFSLSGVNGTISNFRSSALTVELESHKKEMVVRAMIASPLTGSATAQQLDLPDLVGTIDAGSSGIANGLHGNLRGSASLDGLAQNAQVQFNGTLGGSDIKGNLEASGLTPGLTQPVLNFLVDIGQLDLDRFLAPQQKQQGARKFTKKMASGKRVDEPIDLALLDDLEDLNIQGSIRIGLLKAANVTSSGVKLDIRTGQYRDHH
jgi:AsmA protein